MALIVFDLDGTLVDSVDGIAYSMNRVLRAMEYPEHDTEKYKSFVGNGIRRLVELAVPSGCSDEDVNMAFRKMLISYQAYYDYNIQVYEGIYELLGKLSDNGHQLAMITNKHQTMADPIMAKYFGDYPFASVIGRNDSNPKKPDPTTLLRTMAMLGYDQSETYFIGDSEVDLMTARNAGVTDIIVSWGFRDKADMEALEPTHLVDAAEAIALIIG